MRLKEKKYLKKFAAILKKFSAQGAKKVDYGITRKIYFPSKQIKKFCLADRHACSAFPEKIIIKVPDKKE